MAASLLPEKIYSYQGYTDDTLGPYADIAALGNITNRFQGLTVTVLSPVPMECWLPGGKLKSNWRIKRFTSVPSYAKLLEHSNTIFATMKQLLEIGTEATVVADETNDGKTTKYWITAKNSTGVTWEKMNNGGAITVDGDDLPNE